MPGFDNTRIRKRLKNNACSRVSFPSRFNNPKNPGTLGYILVTSDIIHDCCWGTCRGSIFYFE
eukprot:UN4389